MSHFKLLKEIEYLYEDDDVIAVSKPSGLLSIADRFKKLSNLKEVLLEKCEEIFTVHHLDKETSGVMIFAKNEPSQKFLNKQFSNQEVEKIFWAFVQNVPEIDSGIIEVPILNDIRKSGRMHVSKDGKAAQTKFKIVKNYGKICLMAFVVVVVPAPDEPVIAMIGFLADMLILFFRTRLYNQTKLNTFLSRLGILRVD